MKEITLDITVVKKIFNTLKKSLSRDNSRPILQWIKVEVKEDKVNAIALDGYMMTMSSIELKEKPDEEFDFYIQPFYMPTYRTGGIVKFSVEENNRLSIEIKSLTSRDTITYSIQQPLAEFINWRNVIPEVDEDLKICVDARLLTDALNGFKDSHDTKNAVWLKFKRRDNGIDIISPIVLEQKAENGITNKGIVLPIRAVE